MAIADDRHGDCPQDGFRVPLDGYLMETSKFMIKKYWIILVIVFLLLGAFATTLLTSYFVAYRALGDEIREHTLPLTGDNIYSEIQMDLLLSIHISSLMAHDTFVWDWVLDGENDSERIISYLGQIRRRRIRPSAGKLYAG